MNARLALAIAAVTILAVVVYLFVEVRSAPASPKPTEQARPAPRPVPTAVSEATPPPPPPPVASGEVPPPPPVKPAPLRPDLAGVARFPTLPAAADPVGEDGRAKMKNDQVMDQANKAYDRQDFDEARTYAGKVLATQPNNVRMLRIMTSAYCMEGDNAQAQKYYAMLPKFDREQMKVRCAEKSGITFTDPP